MEDEDEDTEDGRAGRREAATEEKLYFSTPPDPFLKLLMVFSDLGPRSENTLKFTWRTLLAEKY